MGVEQVEMVMGGGGAGDGRGGAGDGRRWSW